MFFEAAVSSMQSLLKGEPTKRATQGDAEHTLELPTPSHDEMPFPLLSLPVEIRIQILQLLCPNLYRDDSLELTPRATRADGSTCNTAILRINRQLYLEARDEWYGLIYYRARIHPIGFLLHGYRSSLYKEPPRTLSYIRCLDLEIRIMTPSWMDGRREGKEPVGLYDCTRFLGWCFRPGRKLNLMKLRLRFHVSSGCLDYYRDRVEMVRHDLEKMLKPLKGLKGLTEVTLREVIHDSDLVGKLYNGQHSNEAIETMNVVFEEFVKQLAVEATSTDAV